jgi:hypothetical protein
MDSVNSVQVLSTNEESLKYRVIWSNFAATSDTGQKGVYSFNLPPPTSLANSHEYSQCVIKCDNFTAYSIAGNVNPTWAIHGVATKIPAIELRLNIASAQTIRNKTVAPPELGVGNNLSSGFCQSIPIQIVNIGDSVSATPSAGGYGWVSINNGHSDPLLCANPFGQNMVIRLGTLFSTTDTVYLSDSTTLAASGDIGLYSAQFTIELIKNSSF